MPGREELPDTLRRSPAKAQRTWIKAHDAAVEQYGEGERAHRSAFAALKRTYEKVGDRWMAKDEPGPSDPRSTKPNTKGELYERARRLGVEGRSKMSKRELARALAKKQ
jgi:cation transport regulator ChaB